MEIGQNQNVMLLLCIGAIILLLFLIIVLMFKLNKLQRTYNFLVQGKENVNIEELLTKYISLTRNNEANLEKLGKEVENNQEDYNNKITDLDKIATANRLEIKLELDEKFTNLHQEMIDDHKDLKQELADKYKEINNNIYQRHTDITTNLDTNVNELNNKIETNKELMTADYNKKITELDEKFTVRCDDIRVHIRSCLQKVDLKRYDAFDNITGEQSFTTALLDEDGNGIVISSLYGREDNRSYGKKIVAGKGLIRLSAEEEAMVEGQSEK